MHGKLQIDNNYLKYIVLLLFIGMWGSIGADPYSFLILFDNSTNVKLNFNIINCLNLIRSVFPIISLIFSIGIIVKYNMLSNQDRFIYILLAIQILQLLTTFASQNSFINKIESNIDHIGRYNWIISSIATIFIFIIANRIKQFEIKKLFYLSIFFLIIMILWFTFTSLKDFYTLDVKTSLYNLDVYRDSAYFLGHPMPRLTGLSRSILIIYILVMLVKTNDIKFFIFLKYTILIFLGSLLILYQSKFALVIFFFIKTYFFFRF